MKTLSDSRGLAALGGSAHAAVRSLALRQGGLVTKAQLRELGFSAKREGWLVRAGTWRRWNDLLVVADLGARRGLPTTEDVRLAWMCVLRCGTDAVISGTLAARLAGIEIANSAPLVLVRRSQDCKLEDVRVIRTKEAPPSRSLTRTAGVLHRRWPVALVDALSTGAKAKPQDLADLALQKRWLTADRLRGEIATRPDWWRWGTNAVRSLLDQLEGGTRSEAERRMATLLRRAKIRGWKANMPVCDEQGRIIAEIDFAFPKARLAVEVDGAAHHTGRTAFKRDRDRQNQLTALGWDVLRFTWDHVTRDAVAVASTISTRLCDQTALQGTFRRTFGRE